VERGSRGSVRSGVQLCSGIQAFRRSGIQEETRER
jgi:hypothetical protein